MKTNGKDVCFKTNTKDKSTFLPRKNVLWLIYSSNRKFISRCSHSRTREPVCTVMQLYLSSRLGQAIITNCVWSLFNVQHPTKMWTWCTPNASIPPCRHQKDVNIYIIWILWMIHLARRRYLIFLLSFSLCSSCSNIIKSSKRMLPDFNCCKLIASFKLLHFLQFELHIYIHITSSRTIWSRFLCVRMWCVPEMNKNKKTGAICGLCEQPIGKTSPRKNGIICKWQNKLATICCSGCMRDMRARAFAHPAKRNSWLSILTTAN